MVSVLKELQDLIPALSTDEFNLLEANILAEGIREPIMLWQGNIIDGHNRYKIALLYDLPYTTLTKEFNDIGEVKEWMINNQFGRRNLSAYQRSVLALQLEYIYKEKGRQNEINYGKIGREIQLGGLPMLANPQINTINTRKEISLIANVSHGTIDKVKKIQADASQEVKDKLNSGNMSINEAYKEIKKEVKIENRLLQIEETKVKIKNGIDNSNIENRKYSVITIDPPWNYGEIGGLNSEDYNPQSARGATPYPTMSLQDIINIKLPAADDCVLFLWTTHAFLPHTYNIAKKWGFEYKATIVWDKEKMGIGRNIRMQVEFCLLCIKGKPIIIGSSERDIIRESRREHSRKPEAFYDMVDRMCIGNKLDFFSRENRNKWDTYGAEINKF